MPKQYRSLKKEYGKEGKMCRLTNSNLPRVAIVTIAGNYCNLRCHYCFHHASNQESKQIMDAELLKKFIKEYLELPLKTFTFNWHGGEPLLVGLDFFEQVIRFQKSFRKAGQKIWNFLQTNGTLITKEWASFFKTHDFRVGVSLDGNKKSHDRFRVDKRGRGSFVKVIRGIKILRQYDIEPGILQTLTHDNVSRAIENFRFFVDNLNIKSWAVNPYMDVGGLNGEMLNQRVTNKEFTALLKTYIDLWLTQDNENLQIREIDNFLGGTLRRKVLFCEFNGLCWITFCLNYDGKVYPCDRFLGREEFVCGDLSKQSLLEIFNSSIWQNVVRKGNNLPLECRVCKWQSICHNGCLHLRKGGIEGRYYYCQTRKSIFSYLEKVIKKYPLKEE